MFTLLILLTIVFAVHGSHFDGGSIFYQVVGTNGSKLIVQITQTYTYVYPTIYCNNTYIANQWNLVLSPYADATATLNCTANCSTDGGYTPIPVASKCTDYSVGMAITVGQRTDDVLLNNGSYFTVAYQGSAFRTLNLPGSGGSTLGWSISTVIDLQMRPDGTYNTPPKASMISPIYIPVGVQQTISIPTIDANNDNVRCRFANGTNECGSVCPPSSLPTGTSISSDCQLTITGAKAGDWYAVAIQVEDFANSTTTTPYSSVPVQFLVHVYAQPNCTKRPYLYGPSLDGTCTGVEVGVPYTLTLYVENYCSSYNVTILDIATQSFPVVIKTPIVQNTSTLWSVSLTWTPQPDEIGPQVFCSVGIDSESVQSNQYCLTFTVANGTLGTCPGVEITTTEAMTTAELTTEPPTTTTTTTSTTTITTTAENTTTANNTSPEMTVIIVPVIVIPVCCCCCCCFYWLFYFTRFCRTIDVGRQKKPVTTYTIEGAYVNKHWSLIGLKYEVNDNEANNNSSLNDTNNNPPSTDTSFITLHETSLNTEPLPFKSRLPTDNDSNLSLPLTRQNVPVAPDTRSISSDVHKMMMHHNPFPLSSSTHENVQTAPNTTRNNIYRVPTTISYDRYPLTQVPTEINTSSASATIRNNIYQDNIEQPINPLNFKSLSQSTSSSSAHPQSNGDLPKSNDQKLIRPWTKHPRWVLRLSQPKKIHTPSLTSNRPFSRERPKSSSSAGSTSTIPRYAFYQE